MTDEVRPATEDGGRERGLHLSLSSFVLSQQAPV